MSTMTYDSQRSPDPRSARVVAGNPPALGAVALLVLLVLVSAHLMAPKGAYGQCVRGAVACTNMAGMRTCSATLACSNAPVLGLWTVINNGGTNVTACAPVTGTSFVASPVFTLIAMAMDTSPTTRSCAWSWKTPFNSTMGTVSITTADGLPVELMDFGIEDGDTRAIDEGELESDEDKPN